MANEPNQAENYYTILNCSQTATYDELKQSYQELIKKYHPDKCGGSQDTFLNIDKAWKTLRDENLRNKYDMELQIQAEKDDDVLYAKVSADELDFDRSGEAKYPCRCGSDFTINEQYMVYMEEEGEDFIIECDECSNCLLVKT